MDSRERLVILGTGWGSFRVLNNIDAKKYNVSVVSPRNHLLFTPMLASSALGTVNQRSICQPVRPVTASKKATYYESHAVAIDKDNKRVLAETHNGEQYWVAYDKLVVGVGFQPNDFGTEGVAEHALFMKETADATAFKDHILVRMEEASYTHALDSDETVSPEEEAKLRRLLTFVVVGGGPTGVELAGELTDFLQSEGKKMYPTLVKYIQVHMFTSGLLNAFEQQMQDYAMAHLQKKQGVKIRLSSRVTKVEKHALHVKEAGQEFVIEYGTLVWCAGVKPHKFVRDYGFQMNERQTQILVDGHLRVKGEDNIFALGDCATIDGNWLPQTAQVANQQGEFLANMLNSARDVDSSPEFKFFNKGMMAYLGGSTAMMAKLPGLDKMSGYVAFLGWRFTYWFLQLSFRNKFMLTTDWSRAFLFGRDLTRFGERSRPT